MGQSEDNMSVERLTELYMQLLHDGSLDSLRGEYSQKLDEALEIPDVKAKLDGAKQSLAAEKIPAEEIEKHFSGVKKELPDKVINRLNGIAKGAYEEIEKKDPDLARSLEEQNPETVEKLRNLELSPEELSKVKEGIQDYLESDKADLGKLIKQEIGNTVNEAVDGFGENVRSEFNSRYEREVSEAKANYGPAVNSMVDALMGGYKDNPDQLRAMVQGIKDTQPEFGKDIEAEINARRGEPLFPESGAPAGMTP